MKLPSLFTAMLLHIISGKLTELLLEAFGEIRRSVESDGVADIVDPVGSVGKHRRGHIQTHHFDIFIRSDIQKSLDLADQGRTAHDHSLGQLLQAELRVVQVVHNRLFHRFQELGVRVGYGELVRIHGGFS